MNESSQAIVAVRREVQLSEWQRQVQERQEQGIPVDEWCASLGISKGAYYDSIVTCSNVIIGRGYAEIFKDIYLSAKQAKSIHTSL